MIENVWRSWGQVIGRCRRRNFEINFATLRPSNWSAFADTGETQKTCGRRMKKGALKLWGTHLIMRGLGSYKPLSWVGLSKIASWLVVRWKESPTDGNVTVRWQVFTLLQATAKLKSHSQCLLTKFQLTISTVLNLCIVRPERLIQPVQKLLQRGSVLNYNMYPS
jgi:hypothetical protein